MLLRANQRPPSVLSGTDDPFSQALRPPAFESEFERHVRLEQETESKRISDLIDEEIRRDKERMKRSKQDVKLLLLGQAESGKSTLQKQFQLLHSPASLESERASWKIVILFNVAHSIRRILEALDSWGHLVEGHSDGGKSGSSDGDYASSSSSGSTLRTSHLRVRLSPLVAAETILAERLSGGLKVAGAARGAVFVRSGWQTTTIGKGKGKAKPVGNAPEQMETDDLILDVAKMLTAGKEDIVQLRAHPTVLKLVEKKKLRLDEWAEFFLNQISRIADPDYIPTIEDILHARIQTIGIAEHTFRVDHNNKHVKWMLYDVGGSRTQRHTWAPFFEDANAIIYVAPVSAFDQYLDEDPQVNRIDDSVQLFTQICSNKLLKKVHLVLFLNKTDILKQKLASGIRVNKYITSYGNRPNEFQAVTNYFRAHFIQVHRANNHSSRVLYVHLTNVVDPQAMRAVIINVRDSIFRGYLKDAALV